MVADLKNLVRLEESHIELAGEMLGRAFHDDPLLSYFFPDASQRKSQSRYLFGFRVGLGITYGEVYATSPNLEGVAVWLPYGDADTMPWEKGRYGAGSLSSKIDREAYSRRQSFGDYSSLLHKRYAPSAHWYLACIGVEPQFWGKGYASALLVAMLARIEEEHLPCYLETENKKNVLMYQHFGFEVAEEGIVPGSEVTNWSMLREKIK